MFKSFLVHQDDCSKIHVLKPLENNGEKDFLTPMAENTRERTKQNSNCVTIAQTDPLSNTGKLKIVSPVVTY